MKIKKKTIQPLIIILLFAGLLLLAIKTNSETSINVFQQNAIYITDNNLKNTDLTDKNITIKKADQINNIDFSNVQSIWVDNGLLQDENVMNKLEILFTTTSQEKLRQAIGKINENISHLGYK